MLRTLNIREVAYRWLRFVFAFLELKTRHLAWDVADVQALRYSFDARHALDADETWSD
jgi:high-affinity nickel permease